MTFLSELHKWQVVGLLLYLIFGRYNFIRQVLKYDQIPFYPRYFPFLFHPITISAQKNASSFILHAGFERNAEDYLWKKDSRGRYIGLEYRRRLWHGLEGGLSFSHHFVADFPLSNLIGYNGPYNYLLIADFQNPDDPNIKNYSGIIKLKDYLARENHFGLGLSIGYDFLKSRSHDLLIELQESVNMASTTYRTEDWLGAFNGSGIDNETLRYAAMYEHRAIGSGTAVSICYRYCFKNGLTAGLVLQRSYLFTQDGNGIHHQIGLLIGKRFLKDE